MRKLPCQELLTINYSSRYPSLLCSGRSPPLLMQMTAGPAGSERSTRHLLTVTRRSLAERAANEKGKERGREAGIRYRGEARIATNLHFIARSRDRLATPLGSDLYSFPIYHVTRHPSTQTRIVIRVTRACFSIFAASINVGEERLGMERDFRRCFNSDIHIFVLEMIGRDG
jgi:hypothetical protein